MKIVYLFPKSQLWPKSVYIVNVTISKEELTEKIILQ